MVTGETVRVRKTARFVIVEFGSESEWDGEDDGTGWMAPFFLSCFCLIRRGVAFTIVG